MRLSLAVLEDAFATLQATAGVEGAHARALAVETWGWFSSDDTSHPFAFRVVCDHLSLDADWLRGGAARWRPRRGTPAD